MRCECGADPVSGSSERAVFSCGTRKKGSGGLWLTVIRGERCTWKPFWSDGGRVEAITLDNQTDTSFKSNVEAEKPPVKTPYETAVEIMEEFFPRMQNGPGLRAQMKDRIFVALIRCSNKELGKRRAVELELAELKARIASGQGLA